MNIEWVNTGSAKRRPSRNIAWTAGLFAALSITRTTAGQATGQPADSLAERLRRAEAAIGALQVQIAEQTERAVKTKSKASMELDGRVMVNGFGNSRRVNNVDNPQFVLPDIARGDSVRGVGMAIRQTRLGLALQVPDVIGGAFSADLDVDFYGGQQPSSGGRTFPLLRLRTARGFVRWPRAEVMIGQESPLISGVNPVSPAAIGTPEFAAAGNLWLWLPQARAGIWTKGKLRFGLQGAVLAPTSGDPAAPFDTDYDVAERSQRPFIQGRMSAKWGENETSSEIGCGVHRGWLMPGVTTVASRAFACDATLAFVEWVELRGEFFTGEGLRGLGGGGIGQNFNPTNAPLNTSGGWAQVNTRPAVELRLGLGCGVDHPEPLALRRRNDACAAYTLYRPAGPLFVGAEVRRLRTEYLVGRFSNDYVTIVTGFEF